MTRVAGLKNKMAVVTGASSGIGERIACALAENEVNLCLLGRDPDRLEGLRARLAEMHPGVEIMVYASDLASTENIHTVVNSITRNISSIDMLIHSAGHFLMKSLEDTSEAEFDVQFFVNMRAPFLLTKLLLPRVKKAKGQIVFLNSSVAQQKSRAGLSAYTASKCALQAIADSLREEVNPDQIRVLSVFPGRTATAMQEGIYRQENREYDKDRLLQPDDIAQAIINALTLPRTAEITDIFIRPFRNEQN